MDNINKVILFVKLLSIYGNLISSTQKEILSSYYEYNLSISEIAENKQISRSAVEDAIKKGSSKLLDLEKELEIAKKNDEITNLIDKLKNESNLSKKDIIAELERIINNGI